MDRRIVRGLFFGFPVIFMMGLFSLSMQANRPQKSLELPQKTSVSKAKKLKLAPAEPPQAGSRNTPRTVSLPPDLDFVTPSIPDLREPEDHKATITRLSALEMSAETVELPVEELPLPLQSPQTVISDAASAVRRLADSQLTIDGLEIPQSLPEGLSEADLIPQPIVTEPAERLDESAVEVLDFRRQEPTATAPTSWGLVDTNTADVGPLPMDEPIAGQPPTSLVQPENEASTIAATNDKPEFSVDWNHEVVEAEIPQPSTPIPTEPLNFGLPRAEVQPSPDDKQPDDASTEREEWKVEAGNTEPTASNDEVHSQPQNGWEPLDIREVEFDPAQFSKVRKGRQDNNSTSFAAFDLSEAERAVQMGFALVQRGASYSARSRFIEALRSVARSLDDAKGVATHSKALQIALNAYRESGDFFPKSNRPDQQVNLPFVVGGHSTDVLSDADLANLTPNQCVREYLALAEQQFAAALGGQELGSQALYGIGRLEAADSTTTSQSAQVRTFRTMALYQAAISINPKNFAAANELGVMLAKFGKTEEAIAALRQSVVHSPQSTAWQNLAHLYRKIGQFELAKQAEHEAGRFASISKQAPYAVANPRIEWVEPQEFSRTNPPANSFQVANKPSGPAVGQTPATSPEKKVRSGRRGWPFGAGSFR